MFVYLGEEENVLKIDHFAFGCSELEPGVKKLSKLLGASPIVRGEHQLFGTHNALWRLETRDAPVYLELIAIDPGVPKPARQRWFGLDDANVQARFAAGPKLLTFVVNSSDISNARRLMPLDPGPPVTVTRNDLKWQFSLHDDGGLVANGALPYVIQWAPGPRPVDNMPTQNIELAGIGGSYLDRLDMEFPCEVFASEASLELVLTSAGGERISFSSEK